MTMFDLTREPWIPVETAEGAVVERSTRDVLRDAHALKALCDPSPLVVAALTRHLLAVLHRVYDGPRGTREWEAIVRPGAFDARKVDDYLDRVAARMDLFHPTQPFAQVRGLREDFGKYVAPIDELELVRSEWGLARALFRHRPDDPPPRMSPARAARALLAHHAFVPGGLVKKPGEPVSATAAPLVRAGVVVLRGRTLFETLVSNLLHYAPEDGLPIPTGGQTDACAWEQEPPPRRLLRPDEPKYRPRGHLDLLTWQSRRVELIHEGGFVTGFINAVWKGLDEGAPHDPMVTWKRHEKHGWLSVGIDPERAFWRDANALFESGRGESGRFERPHAISLVASEEARDLLGAERMYAVEVHGLAAEKSRVDAVRTEHVHALARTFDDEAARLAVEQSLSRSQELVEALRESLRTFAKRALAQSGRDPDPAAVTDLVRSFNAEERAWSALGVAFESFLRSLGGDPKAATEAYARRARQVIRSAFEDATTPVQGASRWHEAYALARVVLDERLRGARVTVKEAPAKEKNP